MKLIQTPVEEIYVRALRVAAAKRGIKPTDLAREIFSRALIKEVTDLKLEAEGNNGHQS